MNRVIKNILIAVVAVFMIQATCGKPKPVTISAYEEIEFSDWVYYHNMSITFDGDQYITINGGNESYCVVTTYDQNGGYDEMYDVKLDGRTLFYDKKNSTLYAKTYGLDLWTVSLYDEEAYLKHADVFEDYNSSVAFSPDGKYIYELTEKGYIRIIDLKTGKFRKQIKINTYNSENGYLTSIAASDKYFFIWGESDDQIVALDLNGKYITTFSLPIAGFGFSLSYCNNMLWVAQDADGADEGEDGYWHGYSLTIE